MSQQDNVDDVDAAEPPVELGAQSTLPVADNKPDESNVTNSGAKQGSAGPTGSSQATTAAAGTGSQPRVKLSQGFAKGLHTLQGAAQATKAAAQKVGQKILAKPQKGLNDRTNENETKTNTNMNNPNPRSWLPNKQIVYNEGSIKRNVKRVLVTGGAGFIGSHLVDELMHRGYDVICLDNLFSGSKDNVWKWFGNPNFEFIRHDVTQPFFAEVDEIYHLACPASPVFYQNNPIKTLKTNFVGTYNMLGLAKRVNARMLITSTSEVYGDPTVHPQTEEYWGNVNPIGIRSCYDEGKRVAETLMMEYNRLHNVNIAIARIFNTYGPRMLENDGRVVSNFIVQALNGENLTIYGDGKQTRSFCYIDDQVRGLIKLMESGQIGPINIGNPNEFTIKQLAELTVELIGKQRGKSDSEIKATIESFEKRPLPSDDPKKRKPDITKAKNLLNWQPEIELREGLMKTIEYFDEYLRLTKLRSQSNSPANSNANLNVITNNSGSNGVSNVGNKLKPNYEHSKEHEKNEALTPIDTAQSINDD